jgi:tetratricopeptide (TPR) repeat protein
MMWPQHLAVLYPHPGNFPWWQVAGAGLLQVAITLVAIRTVRRRPYFIVGWLWYLGTLIPVIGLVQVGLQAMADRYTYVPLIGIFVIIAWGFPELLARWRYRKIGVATTAAAVLAIFMVTTWIQVRYWRNGITLFQRSLNITVDNYVLHYNMGYSLINLGKIEEGIAHCREALRIEPNYAQAHGTLGNGLLAQGKFDEAINHYYEVLRLNPFHEKAHNNLGGVLLMKGEIEKAISHFRKAIEIKPDLASAHKNLQIALTKQEMSKEATAKIQGAPKVGSGNSVLHHGRGNFYRDNGELDEAIKEYEKALSIQPGFVPALNDLALLHVSKGEYEKALPLYMKMINLKPDSYVAYYNMACLYARQNKIEESVNWLKKAVHRGFKDWDYVKIDKNLENIRETEYFKKLTSDR